MSSAALDGLGEITREWFRRVFGAPTAVQEDAWTHILQGRDTLVSAPTGTGKTLSAFLVFIDRLMDEARRGELGDETRVLYISPLKSLASDIRENLKRPLDGIAELSREMRVPVPIIRTAVRTGDTSQNDRRSALKRPPHIFITTPESFYLLLTSASGQKMLSTVRAVIIDELHALINSKRGTHLMMSLERLDALTEQPVQRVGLSATISPLELAAQYLSPREAAVAAPKLEKTVRLEVISPFPEEGFIASGTVWTEIARVVLDEIRSARTALAFCEARNMTEKLALYVNQVAGEGFALSHHGSVSKEQRFETEELLRAGQLRLLCATSSMELGIDVGEIDVVLQIGTPRSVSSTMQRLGRAGHAPGRVSVMKIIPREDGEALYATLAAKAASDGRIEKARPPRLCLDVLAQHIVSMVTVRDYTVDELLAVAKGAFPFREVTRTDVTDILEMLAGDYEHKREIPVRPRVLYDRLQGLVTGDTYTRMLALSSGGTIPDRGQYLVKNAQGVKLGEVDEEFTFEQRVGSKFLLGTFAWKITQITKDTVVVEPTSREGAGPPFWKGDWFARETETGYSYGEYLRLLGDTDEKEELMRRLQNMGADEGISGRAADYLLRQKDATGLIPDDRTIIAEHYVDETGAPQVMYHSVFGRRVNSPLAHLAAAAASRMTGMDISTYDDDDGFLLFSYSEGSVPEHILRLIDPDSARAFLATKLPETALFSVIFRFNLAHALMTGVRPRGRNPLWVQRLRAAETLESVISNPRHPLIRETKRECLDDMWDLDSVVDVLRGIRSGHIHVREIHTDSPSPMSLPLRRQIEANLVYEYFPVAAGVERAVSEELNNANMLAPSDERLAAQVSPPPASAEELHTRLMIEGDALAGEIGAPTSYYEELLDAKRVLYVEPGLWIAAEHAGTYENALEQCDAPSQLDITRRMLRYRGGQSAQNVAVRYFWTEEEAESVLAQLCALGDATYFGGLYYHARTFEQARKETVRDRRAAVSTQPGHAYAALLASRRKTAAPRAEQLTFALKALRGEEFSVEAWEKFILPSRVRSYEPDLLDALLSRGDAVWTYTADGKVAFISPEDVDWDVEPVAAQDLSDSERAIYNQLKTRGASFARSLGVTDGAVADTLYSLIEKSAVRCDSFAPLRLLSEAAKNVRETKRLTRARITALGGRFELARPPRELTQEEKILRAFSRSVVLCRETARDVQWSSALELLRLWELTGRVRRGYFVRGMSGAQFVQTDEYDIVTAALSMPDGDIHWLHAPDVALAHGKSLPHTEGREFMAVPGTAVALRGGEVAAVFERRGSTLRLFDSDAETLLASFAKEFSSGTVYAGEKRIVVKEYPKETENALQRAGFSRVMNDLVLYRSGV